MQERESFLDKLRVAATCAVVLLHTVTGVMDTTDMNLYPLEKKVFLITLDMICWCVPVFVMISGYLFLDPKKEISFRKMLTKYCRRIVLALFLFGVPYACMEQIATERALSVGMLGKGFLMVLKGQSWSHMWYLYLILLLYLLTPAMKWLLARTPRTAVYVLLGALAIGSSILPWLVKLFGWEQFTVLPDGAIYFFYYICGYLFATRKERRRSEETAGAGFGEEHSKKHVMEGVAEGRREISARILSAAAAALALGMAASRLSGGYTVQMAYNYPFTVALAILLFCRGLIREGRAAKKAAEKNTGFLTGAAALTFAVYLVHPVFLNILYKFLNVTPLDFSIWVSLPIFFLGILALAFAAAWVLYRVPALRRYVL